MQEAKGRESTKQGQPKSTNQKTTKTKQKPQQHHFPLQQVKQVKQVRRKQHQVETVGPELLRGQNCCEEAETRF